MPKLTEKRLVANTSETRKYVTLNSADVHIDKCRALNENDNTPSFLLYIHFVNEGHSDYLKPLPLNFCVS